VCTPLPRLTGRLRAAPLLQVLKGGGASDEGGAEESGGGGGDVGGLVRLLLRKGRLEVRRCAGWVGGGWGVERRTASG
jgi:hypothetical protein